MVNIFAIYTCSLALSQNIASTKTAVMGGTMNEVMLWTYTNNCEFEKFLKKKMNGKGNFFYLMYTVYALTIAYVFIIIILTE